MWRYAVNDKTAAYVAWKFVFAKARRFRRGPLWQRATENFISTNPYEGNASSVVEKAEEALTQVDDDSPTENVNRKRGVRGFLRKPAPSPNSHSLNCSPSGNEINDQYDQRDNQKQVN
jgi:hypothetical protein